MGLSEVADGWGVKRPPFLKSVKHSTIMKLGAVIPYLKKTQKIYKSCGAPLEFC